ncbi:hypothetical protein M8C21_023763, partial [Ambrosia artemisiifolia]
LFKKSGAGPQNGAQYGAPFNEDEWDDDLVNSIDSQAIVGLVGASITADRKQKGPATTDMTGPGSSVVTISAAEHTSTLNYKQKGLATTSMTEPGSSGVTISANETTSMLNYKQQGPATSTTVTGSTCVTLSANKPTNTLIYKQKGQAKRDMSEPGSAAVTFPANKRYKPTSTLNDEQKGPATTKMAEPGSSAGMFSANEATNTLNYKQKGPATMNMIVPQTTHGLSVTEPGSSSVMNEMPADVDMMLEEDLDRILREPEEANEDDGIFDELGDILTFDDLNGDLYPNPDGPDLRNFVVD